MKACQNVIVTLTIGDEQLDVELPAPVRPGSAHCGVQNACVLRDLGRRKPAGLRYIGVICCF